MKNLIAAFAVVALFAVVGCAKKPAAKPAPAATDITPTAMNAPESSYTPSAYTPSPAYTPSSTPLVSDVTTTPASPAFSGEGTTYTVKKGDTLYAIARAHYGDKGQKASVEKILAANPGMNASVKTGQKILIP